MAIIEFPPLHTATDDGLLALGGDLEIESLVLAYHQGIFPWPISKEYPLAWFSPDPRGVIFVDNLKISKSLKRALNKKEFEVRFNTCFEEVIHACAYSNTRKDSGTWITEELMRAYENLHRSKMAYSVEVFKNNKLVGGLYGVCMGQMISGESMFYKESNASKIALVTLIERMKKVGILWLDTQMVTDATRALGAEELSRDNFIKLLQPSLAKPFKTSLFNP